MKQSFSDTPKKIIGQCYFKRGGNGNNSSEYLAKLGIPTKLISIIGRGSEWMIPELQQLGINTDAIHQINEITPVSTIIKSNFTTKIHLAPNLKDKMNFEGIQIKDDIFEDAKLIFSTPIAEKFIRIFEKGANANLITAFNIETQKVSEIEELSSLIKKRYHFFFLNLKDAYRISKKTGPIEEIDKFYEKFAEVRIYTAGKDGSHILTDNFKLFYPGIEIKEIIDRTGAGDCYAAGFLATLMNSVDDKERLEQKLFGIWPANLVRERNNIDIGDQKVITKSKVVPGRISLI